MLLAFTAQINDGLEQQLEAVVVQRLQDGFNRVALIQGFVVVGVVDQNPVALLVAFLFSHIGGGGVGAGHQLFGFRRVFGDRRHANTDRKLNGSAIDVEQVVFDGLAHSLGVIGHGLLVTRLAHQAEGIVAQAGQGDVLVHLLFQQVGQIAQEQIGAGDADLALHAHEVVEGNVGKGTGLVLFAGFADVLGQRVHQVLSVEQAG